MNRRAMQLLLRTALFFAIASDTGFAQAKDEDAPFQWLNGSGETAGVKYSTHKLRPLAIQNESGPSKEIEQEEVKVDAQTTRITRRVFNSSPNGGRQLTETVVEEIKKLSGDRVRAVRTVSRKNLNGSFSPVQQEVQEVKPAGADTYQINRTLLLPGTNRSLVEQERIQQTEKRKGETGVEIDRTRYVLGQSGSWTAEERRVSQSTLGKDQTSTEEQVYRYDVNSRFSLAQQLRVIESKDASGRTQWQSETYAPNIEGKFNLDSRVIVLQYPMKNGRQQTTEVLERPSPASPNAGLKPVRRIVENRQTVGANETETQLEVYEPDLNGSWRTLDGMQRIELK
jgi:hypothetical protein